MFDPELQVLLSEFKVGIRRYLATIGHSKMENLADLIEFNLDHCEEELAFFGQEIFELAQATSGLDDPTYLSARDTCLRLTRQQGIDRAFRQHRLDAIVGPVSPAPAVPHDTFDRANAAYTQVFNLTGWPSTAVRAGTSPDGLPIGVQVVAPPWREDVSLAVAGEIERALGPSLPGPAL